MNQIRKISLVENKVFPKADLLAREEQRKLKKFSVERYRKLTADELEVLVKNNNTADDWNQVLVSDNFDPLLVRNCNFSGVVRIGKLERIALEFHKLVLPVGLYDSTIVDCDFGENACIHHVNYLSRYIIGREVMIANVNELATTASAKFGNGILSEGESESSRIWMELRNENGGRKVLPFEDMLSQDAWLWSTFRADTKIMKAFVTMTERKHRTPKNRYGIIGDRSVIKNCRMIKDVVIGTDAYLKGANKIKNITLNSSAEAPSQIGEGCELVNGIIGEGSRIFYGVKAVRFILASHSQLKYGARLINSYLGNNSTISCCEVLNALIFPFHEQHHNNSFLCASLLMGQSNMAAGATIGSNHNSRGADGELIAGRGFWPGLCVSLKHNSRFASFTLLAKGDFPNELDIPFPFSLVANDTASNELKIIPAYWFLYNQYALRRNESKFKSRDQRQDKSLRFENRSLAPDSVNEILRALQLLEISTGRAYFKHKGKSSSDDETCAKKGRSLLEAKDPLVDKLEIVAEQVENSKRKAVLLKVSKAYQSYRSMVFWYSLNSILLRLNEAKSFSKTFAAILKFSTNRQNFINVGGQLIPEKEINQLSTGILNGKFDRWEKIHSFYKDQSKVYDDHVLQHSVASLKEITSAGKNFFQAKQWMTWLQQFVGIEEEIQKSILATRKKDHQNPFRKMIYGSQKEMDAVLGSLEENSFLKEQVHYFSELKMKVNNIQNFFNLN